MDFKQQQKRVKIGKMLHAARLEKGLSYQELYFKTGVAGWQIKYIENGTRNYTVDSLIKLAIAIGVNVFDENIMTD